MNNVMLIGRLTRDVDLRYTAGQMAVARFSVAIDRPVKDGKEKEADYPTVVCFGKLAENCDRYLHKGSKAAIEGRLQTGSYTNKDGVKVYTTDVLANRVEFLDSRSESGTAPTKPRSAEEREAYYDGFAALDEDVPF